MNKIEDLRIGQIVYFKNGDSLEIIGLRKLDKFPVSLAGDRPGYTGNYTLDAFFIEKPKIKRKKNGYVAIYLDKTTSSIFNNIHDAMYCNENYKYIGQVYWEEEE